MTASRPVDVSAMPDEHNRQEGACAGAGRYRADITAGSLKIAESRVIADLLLRGVDEAGWRQAITKDNVLKAKNPATAIRLTRLIRQRLEIMSPELWRMVRDGTVVVATHAVLAAAVKHSYNPMNRSALKSYAPKARLDFIRAVTDRAAFYGVFPDRIDPITESGDVVLIGGRAFPRVVSIQRRSLEGRIQRLGFDQVMEAMAYTWFNRFVALRYMELHGYLEHGYRVLSHPEGKPTPEILEHAEHVTLPGLKPEQVINLKLDGSRDAELYRLLLVAQCNALHEAMPFLFEKIADETELLLPDNGRNGRMKPLEPLIDTNKH